MADHDANLSVGGDPPWACRVGDLAQEIRFEDRPLAPARFAQVEIRLRRQLVVLGGEWSLGDPVHLPSLAGVSSGLEADAPGAVAH